MTLNFELLIGGSTHTNHLVPNSVQLYDALDSRTALSFQLKFPSSDSRPAIGAPVYLSNGTSNVYVDSTAIRNEEFQVSGSILEHGSSGYGWLGTEATNYWYCFQAAASSENSFIQCNNTYSLGFFNYLTSSNFFSSVWHSYKGTYTSNNIELKPYTEYLLSFDVVADLTTANEGWIDCRLYGGESPSTLAFFAAPYINDPGTYTTSVSYTFNTSSKRYWDIYFRLLYAGGSVVFQNLDLQEVTLPRIFGGTLDNYRETVLNPLSATTGTYLFLNCNCVDFSQMLGKRLVYKSYVSSGLGEYDTVATTNAFVGDGSNKVFTLDYPVLTTPTITVNSVAASVAAVGAASTFGYYYTLSSNIILGNTSNNALATTDSLSVVYSAIVGKPAYDCDIIKDIADNFLTGENIICGGEVTTGQRINEVNFNYVPANEALNTICDITGRSWYVDPWGQIHYFARSENNAPFDITSTSDNWRSLTIKKSRDKYRNKEYVLGSFGYNPTTETFYGDGKTRTFILGTPVYTQPVITVNGYNASVGVAGVSASTFGYYWARESNIITSNSTNNALASTDTLSVQYLGLYPIVAVSQDGDEIAARSDIELNSGIYEEAAQSNKTYISTEAINYGDSILAKYGKQLDEVEFETDNDGLAAGQILYVKIDYNGLDNYYLITHVTANDLAMSRMRYRVTCVSGTDRGGWVSFFRKLVTGTNQIYTEPYVNLAQTFSLKVSASVFVSDSGVYVPSALTAYLVDAAAVDTATVT